MSELGLTMAVSENLVGLNEDVELVKNGSQISITNENRLFYITSYSNYMLNVRTALQT